VEPALLRIPKVCRTTEVLLGLAKQIGIEHVVMLGVHSETGKLVFLTTDMTTAEANFMLDRMKILLLEQE
jgi:hypothetical protein